MRLRTFTAANMPAAMQLVRDALGDSAVIISSEPLNGSKMISVTAAIDLDDEEELRATPSAPKLNGSHGISDTSIDNLRFDVQNILRFHNIPELFIAKIMQQATSEELASVLAIHKLGERRDQRELHRLTLESLLKAFFSFDPLPSDLSGKRLMLVGPPGIGKTLTVAKLAAKMAMDKRPLVVITTDNKRAGGVEQLKAFTDILNLDLHVVTSRTELLSQLKAIPSKMRVLIDTAGCNAYEPSQIQELKAYTSIEGIEPILAMQAGGDSMETVDIVEMFMELPLKRMLVTRADTARRMGGILAAAAAHNLSFCQISNSSSITGTLHTADAGLLSQLLLRYQLQTP